MKRVINLQFRQILPYFSLKLDICEMRNEGELIRKAFSIVFLIFFANTTVFVMFRS